MSLTKHEPKLTIKIPVLRASRRPIFKIDSRNIVGSAKSNKEKAFSVLGE